MAHGRIRQGNGRAMTGRGVSRDRSDITRPCVSHRRVLHCRCVAIARRGPDAGRVRAGRGPGNGQAGSAVIGQRRGRGRAMPGPGRCPTDPTVPGPATRPKPSVRSGVRPSPPGRYPVMALPVSGKGRATRARVGCGPGSDRAVAVTGRWRRPGMPGNGQATMTRMMWPHSGPTRSLADHPTHRPAAAQTQTVPCHSPATARPRPDHATAHSN